EMPFLREAAWWVVTTVFSILGGYFLSDIIDVSIAYLLSTISLGNVIGRAAFVGFWTGVEIVVLGEDWTAVWIPFVVAPFLLNDIINVFCRIYCMYTGRFFSFYLESYLPSIYYRFLLRAVIHVYYCVQEKQKSRLWFAGQGLLAAALGCHFYTYAIGGSLYPDMLTVGIFILDIKWVIWCLPPSLLVINLCRAVALILLFLYNCLPFLREQLRIRRDVEGRARAAGKMHTEVFGLLAVDTPVDQVRARCEYRVKSMLEENM
ncbi:hypothetical protein PMAYCL1PPCAC_25194, partial [Pristionchus mayeri]